MKGAEIRIDMKKLLMISFLIFPSCSINAQPEGPEEGMYWSDSNKLFYINRSGPTPLSIVGGDGFCLLFNRGENQKIVDEIELLYGYGCNGFDQSSDKKWVAVYKYGDLNEIEIYSISKNEEIQSYHDLDGDFSEKFSFYRGCNGPCSRKALAR